MIYSQDELLKKGLDYFLKLKEFKVKAIDYAPHNIIFKMLLENTDYKSSYSNVFEGAIYHFEKRTEQEIERLRIQNDLDYAIKYLEKRFNIKITYDKN